MPTLHQLAPAWIAAALFTTACLGLSESSLHAGKADRHLDIYWIDSEGGGSTLIVTPEAESILIDSGNPGGRDSSRIHHVITQVAKLNRLDFLITTHLHIDHFGGAAELAQLIPIGTVYDNGIPETDPDGNKRDTRWPLVSKPYRAMKVDRRVVVQAGTQIPLKVTKDANGTGTELKLTCVATRKELLSSKSNQSANALCTEAKSKPVDTSDNANSSVWILEFGAFRFFDGGDLTWNIEGQLVCPTNRIGTVDVYQVNHHGLDVSSNPMLVHSLMPTVAVMNNGPRKGTAGEVLNTLRTSPGIQQIFQVHKNVREDLQNNVPDECIANLEEKCSAHFIHLNVQPGGNQYRVNIPASGKHWDFRSRSTPR